MIFILANILLFFGVFTGIGLLWPRTVFAHNRQVESGLLCFWIGWGIAVGFLQLWHLFLPVGLPAMLILIGASAAGWVRNRGVMVQTIRSWSLSQKTFLVGLSILPAVLLSNNVLFGSPISDYALYHLQSVKWISTYRIIPGLGNLYNPLAINGASFLYSAVLDTLWLEGRAYTVSITLPAFVLLLQCANGFYSLLTRGKIHNADLFYALMIPFALLEISTSYPAGYSPDPFVFFLPIVFAGELLRMFNDGQDVETFRRRAGQLIFLAAVAITVKLSLAVFSALCILAVLFLAIVRYAIGLRRQPRTWWLWMGAGAALIVPWMVRNVILSGYPLFPSNLFPMPVPWRMPVSIPFEATRAIFIWAATHNNAFPYTGDWAWFQQWWNGFPFFVRQAFLFTLILVLFNQVLLALQKGRARRDWGATALSLIAVPSIVFWFLAAPGYRFSGSLFWIFFTAELLVAFRLFTSLGWVKRPDLVAISLVMIVSLWQSPNHFSNNLSRRLLLIPPTEQQFTEAAHPSALYRQRVTSSGLVVYLPREGVEECWNAPLPCTTEPNFSPNIRTLRPDDLRSGFTRSP